MKTTRSTTDEGHETGPTSMDGQDTLSNKSEQSSRLPSKDAEIYERSDSYFLPSGYVRKGIEEIAEARYRLRAYDGSGPRDTKARSVIAKFFEGRIENHVRRHDMDDVEPLGNTAMADPRTASDSLGMQGGVQWPHELDELMVQANQLDPTLAMTLLARALGGAESPALKQAILASAVPRVLQRAEKGKRMNGERLADLAIGVLRGVGDSPIFVGQTVNMLPDLHGQLMSVPPVDRGPGWLQSLVSLGMQASRCVNALVEGHELWDRSNEASIFYYHEVLRNVLNKPELADADTVRAAANNLAASLSKLASSRLGDNASVNPVAKRLQHVVLASALVGEGVQIDAKVYEKLGFEFGGEADPRIARILEAQGQDSNYVDDSIIAAHRHAVQGVISVARRNGDRVAASFFNSGVTMSRMTRERKVALAPLAIARVVMNVAGGCYALEFSDTLEAALVENDGADCFVNFGGSLSSLKDNDVELASKVLDPGSDEPSARELLIRVFNAARGFGGTTWAEVDARLGNSMRSLGVQQNLSKQATLQDLQQRARAVLRNAVAVLVDRELANSNDLDAIWMASVVNAVFDRLDRDGPPEERGILRADISVRSGLIRSVLQGGKSSAGLTEAISAAYPPLENGPITHAGIDNIPWGEVIQRWDGTKRPLLPPSAVFAREFGLYRSVLQ